MVVVNRPAQREPRPVMSTMREDGYTSSIEAQPVNQSYGTKVRYDILMDIFPRSRFQHAPISWAVPCA